ncbi:hypothetical protein BK138_13440 [Paenibacillus rhizosphaerae]|uniref:DUF4227 domain-containing protein n=1 Tax=Paenibacillus rhizosphaerae TaxID=297318 RepID=A0A1R1EVC3_9BACL|nr:MULTISPECIES: DUF4227 family protein [Paenibacillus]OMF55652.1 hypothetical protein BK138_13440 [Paenibacillus rhizosphaerae]GIO58956.1 hypothetical protein J43TS9_05300 [Paenibacillus cineris]
MIIPLRKWLSVLKFLIVFVSLAYMFYHVLTLFTAWITPVDHYRIPEGHAVKAFQSGDGKQYGERMGDRLRFYFWYGE